MELNFSLKTCFARTVVFPDHKSVVENILTIEQDFEEYQ